MNRKESLSFKMQLLSYQEKLQLFEESLQTQFLGKDPYSMTGVLKHDLTLVSPYQDGIDLKSHPLFIEDSDEDDFFFY